MIDLSYKPRKAEPKEDPIGIVILGSMPFAAMLAWIILAGLAH